jgi:pimeloyl-ACP methyl ester carboxylesterase
VTRLHYAEFGKPDGRAVLFLHGWPDSWFSFSRVLPLLPDDLRALAIDQRGFGDSDRPESGYSIPEMADDAIAFLDALDIPRATLVGHSFGSFVVRAFAARRPEQVVGLVLVDPATEWLTADARRTRLLRGGQQLSRVGALLAHAGVVRACLALLTGGAPAAPRSFVKIFGPTAAQTLERLVGEVRKLPPELHPAVRALWCQPKCFHAVADHMSVLERGDPLISITGVALHRDIPVVVLSGGNQPAEQLAAHRMMAEASDRGRHVVASKSAHWIQFDEPELIVAAIKEIAQTVRV